METYRISSNISGLFRSRIFIRSFIAMMIVCVLSSAPCFELFSAAPTKTRGKSWLTLWNSIIQRVTLTASTWLQRLPMYLYRSHTYSAGRWCFQLCLSVYPQGNGFPMWPLPIMPLTRPVQSCWLGTIPLLHGMPPPPPSKTCSNLFTWDLLASRRLAFNWKAFLFYVARCKRDPVHNEAKSLEW